MPPPDSRPNILWFCTDQQRYDTISALGNPFLSTPNLDRLVREGVAFERAYCQSPICTPSRASFLTGRYPSSVHVNGNGNESFPDHPPLVTRLLANAGYDCGLIGKLHLAGAYRRVEPRADDGYRYWQYSHAPRDDWEAGHDYADWVRSRGHALGELTQSPDGVPAELHQTTWCAEKTIEFLRQERDGPWLASVNPYDPHPPFNPPRQYRDRLDPAKMPSPLFQESDLAEQRRLEGIDFQSRARTPDGLDISSPIIPLSPGEPEEDLAGARDARTLKAAYYAMVELIDDQFGRILDALEETGQRENTLIVFTSDHGEMLGDHGLIQKGCRFYEGLVRVPLVFSWPALAEKGLAAPGLVELTDIAPTLLAAAGLPVPSEMHGRSLLPVLTGQTSPAQLRDFVRCEYYNALDSSFCRAGDATYATMYRDERYKLVLYHGHGLGELYDLEEDPGEFRNLWDDAGSQDLRADLVQKSFDASMLSMDWGPRRIGPM